MKFSLNLIKKFVDLKGISIKEIIDKLIFSGFEIEESYTMAEATNLVVGEIKSCINHPNSDHLHLLKVDCGNKVGVLDIVCGAPNAREGIKVIVAQVGAKLPRINLEIKESVIRGQKSCGMCCSLVELGVDKEILSEKQINGIEELPTNFKVGSTNVLELLNLDDTILDINILPNRPDCFCYYGIAREIGSLFERKVSNIPELKSLENKKKIKILTKNCSRFDLININDIKLKETPQIIKRYLNASGIRSISPLVDLGNYAMLLTGLPVNIYDLDKIKNYLVVRDDLDTKVITFDNKEIEIKKGDLLICDKNIPVCIAGIMALKNASVTNETKNIAIEIAAFSPSSIRQTSNRLGLVSFSSNLFSKGRNPLLIDEAISTLISLLNEFVSSYKIGDYSSVCGKIEENKYFDFSIKKLNERLGSNYSEEEINRVLNAYNITKKGKKVCGPIYRTDLKEQCDIDEEVFRYYPVDKLNINLNSYPHTLGIKTIEQQKKDRITSYLIDNGFYQILSYTLIDERLDKLVRVFSNLESYKVTNPMTKDHEIIRSDLLPSMIDTIKYNVDHFNNDFKLFELSYLDTKDGPKEYLSFGLVGKKYVTSKMKGINYSFYDLKGIIFNILNILGFNDNRISLEYSKNKSFHPLSSADIHIDRKFIGTFGLLHPLVEKNKYIVGEIDLTALFELKGSSTKFSVFNSNPYIRRELTFELNSDKTYDELVKVIKTCGIQDLKEVDLFDIYEDNQKSTNYTTISLLFSNDDHTLKNEEIDLYVNKILSEVRKKLDIYLRK